MILKGSQRGNALQLARHLLNSRDNDHVDVYELRGFSDATLTSAMHEAVAIAKGTRCRQFLFSVSLNPPESYAVAPDGFVAAADEVECKLGLQDQPRAIILHEKDGRRHAHAVWSRIDIDTMTAINLSHFKRKLQDVSKQLFREHGWRLPAGLADPAQKNPFNFSRAEWQQAKRLGLDAKALKALFKECWDRSDTGDALRNALAERGFLLAKGDRRAVVVIDYRGEVYALARWAGVKTKELRARIGDDTGLPVLSETKAQIGEAMSAQIRGYIADVRLSLSRSTATLALKQAQLKERHVAERETLQEAQARRWVEETKKRAARFRGGFKGIWDRLTGRHTEVRRRNEQEAHKGIIRDNGERDALTRNQLTERRKLQTDVAAMRQRHHKELENLRADVAAYAGWSGRSANVQAPGSFPDPAQAPVRDMRETQKNGREEPGRDL